MTINANNLVIQVNSLLASNSTSKSDLDTAITSAKILENQQVVKYALSQFPDAQLNPGKIIFDETKKEYYFSEGCIWQRNFKFNKQVYSLAAWGTNSGRLGDNTTTNRSSPVNVNYDWLEVSAGGSHTAAIRTNGTLWTWGSGSAGQLGNNDNATKCMPVSIVGGFTDWCHVSAGLGHNVALRTNGTIWTWGCNSVGRLGDGTTVVKSSPVSVVGGFTDWCQVSAGASHTAAVRTNGTVWTWGFGACGRLGDGTTTDKSSPVSIIGGFTDWCQVSAGFDHTAAIRTNGTLWTWGCGSNGRLGDGTTIEKCSPVSIIGGFTDWCQVSAGGCHTGAIRTNGTLWTWGLGTSGKLGDGGTTSQCSPVSVIGGFTDWCQVSAGGDNTAAVRTNGTLWNWGAGGSGRLGDNTVANKTSPVSVVGVFTNWCQVSVGTAHTTAIFLNNICPIL